MLVFVSYNIITLYVKCLIVLIFFLFISVWLGNGTLILSREYNYGKLGNIYILYIQLSSYCRCLLLFIHHCYLQFIYSNCSVLHIYNYNGQILLVIDSPIIWLQYLFMIGCFAIKCYLYFYLLV